MARDSSGNYSLPSGNPVATGTTIDSTVHNNTTTDIASELTDSLSRSGKGSMSAVLKIVDGSASAPGLEFANDTNTGVYRVTTDTLGLSAGGTLVLKGEAAVVTIPVKLVVESTAEVDLSDSSAGFAVGTLSGQHVEVDVDEIQSKSDATTAAILALNKSGGNVNIGAQSGTGAVNLYFGGDLSLSTIESGIQVRDGDGSVPTIDLVTSAGTTVGRVLYSSGMSLSNLVNSGTLSLLVKDSAGNSDAVFVGTPDSGVTLYYSGTAGFIVTNVGAQVFSSVNDNPAIELYQDDKSTRNAFIQGATSGLYFYQEVHGAPIVFVSENNSGAQKTIFTGDPDSAATTYYAGTPAVSTTDIGVRVYPATTNDAYIELYQDDLSTRNGYIGFTTSGVEIRNEVHGATVSLQSEDNGGTNRNLLVADPDGAATAYYAGTAALATADVASNGTGATVTDGGGTARPVGFNITPITTVASGTDLRIANSGHLLRATGAGAFDIDTTTDTAPNGSFWTIENAAGTSVTVTATGVNLLWLDGTSGSTGGRTLAAYGYVTIFKISNGNYRIIGTGLS